MFSLKGTWWIARNNMGQWKFFHFVFGNFLGSAIKKIWPKSNSCFIMKHNHEGAVLCGTSILYKITVPKMYCLGT